MRCRALKAGDWTGAMSGGRKRTAFGDVGDVGNLMLMDWGLML